MKFRVPASIACALLQSSAGVGAAESQKARSAAECVQVTTFAPYAGPGYNHVVHLKNVCAESASCSVTTDVNPDAIQVAVPGKSETDIITFRGSPASTFTPKVVCSLESRH